MYFDFQDPVTVIPPAHPVRLGASWRHTWSYIGPMGAILASHLEPSPVSYVAGAILEPSWSHLGFALGAILHVGPYLPHAWSHLGGHLGFTLGAILHWEPYWPHTWSHLGHALGAILEPSWPPHRGACLGLYIVVRPGVPRAQLLFSPKKTKA